MTAIASFDDRVEWMDDQLELMDYDVESIIIGPEGSEKQATWPIIQDVSHICFIGTKKNQQYFDIHYQYNLMLDMSLSFEPEQIISILDRSGEEEVNEMRAEAPGFIEEIESDPEEIFDSYGLNPYEVAKNIEETPEEIADTIDVDLDNFEEPEDSSESQEPAENGDETPFDMDWAAARIRLMEVSDKSHERLSLKLNEILSEGPLSYQIKTNKDGRIHKFVVFHRIFGIDELKSQDVYESLRLVWATGHYAQNYLRFALRIRDGMEEFSGDPQERIDIP